MSKKVTIYSTATCGYCKMLKGYLISKKVDYEVKNADQDPDVARELYEKSGQLGVPFTIVETDDGKEEKILGFDRPRVDQVLGLK
ncbi:glutaredoxin family protein [Candidatus Parcubacteria bacterium]|nr:glutaredoxin family protein [Candidatus Parcubacteria bacterium]